MAKNKDRVKPEPVPAPEPETLPNLLPGCVWDTTDIGRFRFRVQVPAGVEGIVAICKGDENLAARKFARALRIDIASKLDARAKFKACKDMAQESQLAKDLQIAILDFDASKVKERGPRPPVDLKGLKVSKEVLEALKKAGVKVTL